MLAAATLDVRQWRALFAVADEETRGFIATLHPEVRAAAPAAFEAERLVEVAAGIDARGVPAIRYRIAVASGRDRPHRTAPPAAFGPGRRARPAAACQGSPALFRWECGPGGEIAWVEGAPRGPLIGRSIARQQENDGDRVDADVVRAFAMRAPFRDALLRVAGAGPVAGEWKISGIPAFEPSDGRFAGYRGVALRDTPVAAAAAAPREAIPEVLSDPDSLRELVHEIKTPLNAIMGFAEIIEGQYLGPADRGYRERAAEIGRQARLLLTAIDDLDFAAKVHSAKGSTRERVDLGALVDRAAARAARNCRQARDRGRRAAGAWRDNGGGRAGTRRPAAVPAVRRAGRPDRAGRAAAGLCRGDRRRSANLDQPSFRAQGDRRRRVVRSAARARGSKRASRFGWRAASPGLPAATWSAAAMRLHCYFRAPDRQPGHRALARRKPLSISRGPGRACSSTVELAAHNG